MQSEKRNDHIKPCKSNFLNSIFKTLKDRIVLCETGFKFHSFGAGSLHDFKPKLVVLIFDSFKMSFPFRS